MYMLILIVTDLVFFMTTGDFFLPINKEKNLKTKDFDVGWLPEDIFIDVACHTAPLIKWINWLFFIRIF